MTCSALTTISTAGNVAAHQCHRRTHRRALNTGSKTRPAQAAASTSPQHQQPESSNQRIPPRNAYPQLGLQLSQWVEEQMEVRQWAVHGCALHSPQFLSPVALHALGTAPASSGAQTYISKLGALKSAPFA
eukprot:1160322-Pelagomonas_calceolata.AAC.3